MALALVAPLSSCTSTQRDGESPAYLILDSLNAASGAAPDTLGGTLASDVLTLVPIGEPAEGEPQQFAATIVEDLFSADFSLALKDPGSSTSPTTPTSANSITITRYRVDFVRADGRNTPGVDVPYGFDGAATVTVGGGGATAAGVIVRQQAKREAPLQALAFNGGAIAISTIARITFYGHDQAGRSVSVTGQISVNFADWADPE
jgi:hypothetical protein